MLELLLEIFRVALPVAEALRPEVLLAEAFFAALTLRPGDLLAPLAFLVRLAVRGALLLAEPDLVAVLLLRALVFTPAFAPLFRAAVFVPLVLLALVLALVRALAFRTPEVGLAALRAALFRFAAAPEEPDELDFEEDLDDDGERLAVLPVREPALRLELLGDDFFAAML